MQPSAGCTAKKGVDISLSILDKRLPVQGEDVRRWFLCYENGENLI